MRQTYVAFSWVVLVYAITSALNAGALALESSPDSAIAKAFAVLGLEPRPLETPPVVVSLNDDRTPYLATQLANRRAWKVTVEGPFDALSDKITRLHCILDRQNGRVIRIASDSPTGEPPLPEAPSSTNAAEQMQRSGQEIYHGFPDAEPGVSLFEALRTLEGRGLLIARQIDCQYVQWSRIGNWREPRAVWAITLVGIPPMKPPLGTRTDPVFSFRYIVDAQTGEWLCGSNTPRPE